MALTPQEIEVIINQFIIDNTTNQITPAKVRYVLKVMNAAIKTTDASAVLAIEPLFFDSFTNQFSIRQVSNVASGFLTGSDYAEFKQNLLPIAADRIELKQKGWKGGIKNTGANIELGDICQGWNTPGEWIDSMMYVSLGNDQDVSNYERIYSANVTIIP